MSCNGPDVTCHSSVVVVEGWYSNDVCKKKMVIPVKEMLLRASTRLLSIKIKSRKVPIAQLGPIRTRRSVNTIYCAANGVIRT